MMNWRDKQWRKRTIRYWLEDPFWGNLCYLLYHALRYMPISVNAKIGAIGGELAGKYILKTENARVKHNLEMLYPELSETEREVIAAKVWQHYGQGMAEYPIMGKFYASHKVTLENIEYLQPFLDHKQPIIFVSAHTGNWEVIGNYVIDYGVDLMALYKPVRNRFLHRIADHARAQLGGAIHLLDANAPNAMRRMCKHLANKGALWITIDEVKNKQVCSPRFDGTLPSNNTNIAYAVRLARHHHAALITLWTKRNPDNSFTAKIGAPIMVADDDHAAAEALLKLDGLLEEWIRANVEQWGTRLKAGHLLNTSGNVLP